MLLSRYSYTLEYYLSIKYSLFSRLRSSAFKGLDSQKRDQFLKPAFHYWLEHVSGSKNSISFGKMCEEIGIIEKPKSENIISKKIKSKKAISRAEEIIKMDKQRKVK